MAVSSPALCGLVLAAGAGTRFGGPKALALDSEGTPWVARAVRMLRDAGCDDVLVMLGASADQAVPLVPTGARIVVVDGWQAGLSATLRAGVDAASALPVDAALITPVDTPSRLAGSRAAGVRAGAGHGIRGSGAGARGVRRRPGSSGADRTGALDGAARDARRRYAAPAPTCRRTPRSRWSAPTCGRAPTSTEVGELSSRRRRSAAAPPPASARSACGSAAPCAASSRWTRRRRAAR